MSAAIRLSEAERAVLKTLTYASIFQYPLTAPEIAERLIGLRLGPVETETVLASSVHLSRLFERSGAHYHPIGKGAWVRLRKEREERSTRRLRENRLLLKLICSIPYTRLVALSGSAAHLNMNGGGDIDLFIVTRGRKVWSVALSILLLSKLFRRRKWICFNFLVSDQKMALRVDDLFSANQLVHLRPLIGKETLEELLRANPFAKRHYPSPPPPARLSVAARPGPALGFFKQAGETLLSLGIGGALEAAARALYRRHLRSKAASWSSPDEVILGEDLLKLHTESHKRKVLRAFEEELAANLGRLEEAARPSG